MTPVSDEHPPEDPYEPPYGGQFPASQYPPAYPGRPRHSAPRQSHPRRSLLIGLAVVVAVLILISIVIG